MSLILPNIEDSPPFAAMAVRDSADYFAMSCAPSTGVISGGKVTQDTGSDLSIDISSLIAQIGGVQYSAAGITSFSLNAANATDRRDAVIYRVGTGFAILEGTPCTTSSNWSYVSSPDNPPVKPTLSPTTDVLLAEVYVNGSATSLTTSGNIVDKTNILVAMSRNIMVVNSAVTIGSNPLTDYVVFLQMGASPTMPDAIGNNNRYTVKNETNINQFLYATNNETFDGNFGPLVIAPYTSYDLLSDGANWWLV